MIEKKKLIEKLIHTLLNIFIGVLSIILLITIYSGLQIKILKQDYANFFGYSMFEVQTNSMAKKIYAGDWIVVKLDSDIKVNDIITYKKEGDYITHRVTEIKNQTYVTRGDANSSKDPDSVDYNQIVGKVTKVLKGFGIFKKTIFNSGVLIILIIALFIVESLIKEKNDSERKFNINFKKINKKIKKIIGLFNNKSSNVYLEKTDEPTVDDDLLIIDGEEESEIVEVKTSEEDGYKDDFEDEKYEEDELEKTIHFRMVEVNPNEIDETLLEIAKHEIEEDKKTKEVSKITVEVEEGDDDEIDEETDLTNINFENLTSGKRKNKNTIDAFVNLKLDELEEIIQLIIDEEKLQTNEPTIKNNFLINYIHARYYNYFSGKDLNYKGRSFLPKFNRLLNALADDYIKDYDGSDKDYEDKVNRFIKIFQIVAKIEHSEDSLDQIPVRREFIKNELEKFQTELDDGGLLLLTNEIIKVQRRYNEIYNYFFKKLESNTFYLKIERIIRNLYAVDLNHSVNFSKIYSDYIIDKTYEEGVIAEDKLMVKITLLLKKVIEDMLKRSFRNKYFIVFPDSLYAKHTKIMRVTSMFEDEYAKSHISILIDFDTLTANKRIVSRLRRKGYRFAIGFNENVSLLAKDKNSLSVGNILFVNKKAENYDAIEKYIPADLKDIIIYNDVYDKFNIVEGD